MSPVSSRNKIFIIAGSIILLVVVFMIWKLWLGGRPEDKPIIYTSPESVDIVRVATTTATSKLPSGFPTGIPVEESRIEESYKIYYKELGVTQYTVSFTSKKSREVLWKEYVNTVRTQGLALDPASTDEMQGKLRATGGKKTLNVFIAYSLSRGAAYVKIDYSEKD